MDRLQASWPLLECRTPPLVECRTTPLLDCRTPPRLFVNPPAATCTVLSEGRLSPRQVNVQPPMATATISGLSPVVADSFQISPALRAWIESQVDARVDQTLRNKVDGHVERLCRSAVESIDVTQKHDGASHVQKLKQ